MWEFDLNLELAEYFLAVLFFRNFSSELLALER